MGQSADTATLALRGLGRPSLPVRRSWRFNERHYGALKGRPIAEVAAQWRLSPGPPARR